MHFEMLRYDIHSSSGSQTQLKILPLHNSPSIQTHRATVAFKLDMKVLVESRQSLYILLTKKFLVHSVIILRKKAVCEHMKTHMLPYH